MYKFFGLEKEFFFFKVNLYLYTLSLAVLRIYHWHSWVCIFTKKREKKHLKNTSIQSNIHLHMCLMYVVYNIGVYLLFKTTPNFTLNNFQFAIDIQKQTIKFMYSRRPFFILISGVVCTLWYLLSYHRFFVPY